MTNTTVTPVTENSNVETSPIQVAISANSESHITATSDAEAIKAEVMVEQHIEPTATDVGAIEVTETANVEPAESDITEPQITTTPDVEVPSRYAVLPTERIKISNDEFIALCVTIIVASFRKHYERQI